MKFRTTCLLLLPLAYGLFLGGCKMPNGGVPVYMKIDSVNVLNPNGTLASNQITDVWVEANNDNVGAFGLPCNFPVLQENNVRFVISAGIKESGQSGVRAIYPFYTTDTFSINAARGSQYSHLATFKYVQATQFAFDETFDFSNSFTGDTLILRPEGGRCAAFSVNAVDSAKEISQNIKYDLPEGQEIWLELDYKSDVPFFIGYYGTFNGSGVARVPVLFVTGQPNWHKLYVKLSYYVGTTRADTYNIYFEALRPFGTTGGTVYIDDVRLVHF